MYAALKTAPDDERAEDDGTGDGKEEKECCEEGKAVDDECRSHAHATVAAVEVGGGRDGSTSVVAIISAVVVVVDDVREESAEVVNGGWMEREGTGIGGVGSEG